MKTHIIASLASLASIALNAGWFWSMGLIFKRGEGLGSAYVWTVMIALAAYAMVIAYRPSK